MARATPIHKRWATIISLAIVYTALLVYSLLQVGKRGSEVPGLFWIAILILSLWLHTKVHRIYSAQLSLVRRDENTGGVEKGTSLVIANQRFRYTVRRIEATGGLVVGVLGIISVSHPAIAASPWFGRAALLYFYGSLSATAYLSWRDLDTLRSVQKIDFEQLAKISAWRNKYGPDKFNPHERRHDDNDRRHDTKE